MKKIGLYLLNYNYSDFLSWAIRSIDAQTRQPDIKVFIDDCSADKSLEVFNYENDKLKFKYDVLLNAENIGTVKSMNKAVKYLIEKKCDYIMGLSADDVMHKDYIKLTEKELNKAPKNVGYIYTWVQRIGDEFTIDKHEEFNSDNLMKYNFVHGSSLMKTSICQEFPDVGICEDWEFYKSLARKGVIGKLIPKPLLYWRRHSLKSRTECGIKGITADGVKRKD